MNMISIDRGVDFFIAYLAKHSEDLSLDIPFERSAYHLIEDASDRPSGASLNVEIPLEEGIVLKGRAYFGDRCDATRLDELAEEFADRLNSFVRDRDELLDEAIQFQSRAKAAFAKLPAKSPMKFVSVDIVLDDGRAEARCVMTYELLGEDAKPAIETAHILEASDVDAEIRMRRDDQKLLASRAAELSRAHADGAIDAVLAQRLERHSAYPLSFVESAQNPPRSAFVSTPDGQLDIFWKAGILTAGINLTDNFKYHGGFITVKNCPKHFAGDATGRNVSELFDHPDFPDDLVFASGFATPGKKCDLEVTLQYSMFDNESGVIW